MKLTTETRELFTLDVCGVAVRGTYHLPRDRPSAPGRNGTATNRTGIVLVNSLSLPRASTGDTGVYWADSFAKRGYPSFRIDLPGMGDSGGVVPSDLLTYIALGGYAAALSNSLKQLVKRFRLSGVVILGLCAGATSAVMVAADTSECVGLILMDPSFYLPQPRPKVRRMLTDWAARSALGGCLSDLYDRVKHNRLRLQGHSLPKNANRTLLSRWRKVASSGLPILLLKAPETKASGAKPRVGEFDYLKYVLELAGRKNQLVVEVIEGADHPFANGPGRTGVRQQAGAWIAAQFPLHDPGESAVAPGKVPLSEYEPEIVSCEPVFARVEPALESGAS
jgi:pimeloyl-ACP methyl ester carboxylesterase